MTKTKIVDKVDIDMIAVGYQEDSYVISRFATGLCHYVFNVKGKKSHFVVRVCKPENVDKLRGNIFWTKELEKENLPLPKILKSSIGDEEYSYVILEYLDGVDLGKVVSKMNSQELDHVVDALASYDEIAKKLPLGSGCGWGMSYSCPQLLKSWPTVISKSIQSAQVWIEEVGRVNVSIVDTA